MRQLTPQPSINDMRTQALMTLVTRLDSLDLSSLLVYRIDSTPEPALPFLFWQFDLQSPLWRLLAPSATSRALLRLAVSLHRLRGTPYAIKASLASLGYQNVELLEGQDSWNGIFWPADQG